MNATEFLRKRKVVTEDKHDLIIGFDNGTQESLIELLDAYVQETTEAYEQEIDNLKDTIDNELDVKKLLRDEIEEKQARIEELESELQEKEPATVLDQLKKEIIDRFIELPISELTFIEDMYFKGKIV